jgi:hypothetical protein
MPQPRARESSSEKAGKVIQPLALSPLWPPYVLAAEEVALLSSNRCPERPGPAQ